MVRGTLIVLALLALIFAALGIASGLLGWYWRGQIAPQLTVRCAWHLGYWGEELVLNAGDEAEL